MNAVQSAVASRQIFRQQQQVGVVYTRRYSEFQERRLVEIAHQREEAAQIVQYLQDIEDQGFTLDAFHYQLRNMAAATLRHRQAA
ncbi:hypothetical protein [Thiomonas sp.]